MSIYSQGRVPFDRALTDETGGQRKILRRDYLRSGVLPVIDQGRTFIAGYTNDRNAAYSGPLPVILFGDHTRIFKYVDFTFALGADGVKVLRPSPLYDPKFIYYYMKTREIPARGYSRHFKFLKQVTFPPIPLSGQHRIVDILDQIDHLRRLQEKADTKANRILPSIFIQMFGDPVANPMNWPVVPLRKLGRPLSGGIFPLIEQGQTEGDVPFIKVSDMNTEGNEWFIHRSNNYVSFETLERLKVRSAPAGTIVFPKIGAAVATNKKRLLIGSTAYDNNVVGIVPWDIAYSAYLFGFFILFDLKTLIRSTALPSIKTSEIMQLNIAKPPRNKIDLFTKHFNILASIRKSISEERNRINRLFNVVIHRTFEESLIDLYSETHMHEAHQNIEQETRQLAYVESIR